MKENFNNSKIQVWVVGSKISWNRNRWKMPVGFLIVWWRSSIVIVTARERIQIGEDSVVRSETTRWNGRRRLAREPR